MAQSGGWHPATLPPWLQALVDSGKMLEVRGLNGLRGGLGGCQGSLRVCSRVCCRCTVRKAPPLLLRDATQVPDFSKFLFGCSGLLPDMVRLRMQYCRFSVGRPH